MVVDMLVGTLKGYEGPEDALEKGSSSGTGADSSAFGPLVLPALVAVLAVAYFFLYM